MFKNKNSQLFGRCAPRLPIRPFAQKDDYSCGLHALQALYSYYGLNASRSELDSRLGVKYSTPFFIPGRDRIESQFQEMGWSLAGTWPWDLFLVIAQDGFQIEPLHGRLNSGALPALNREIKNRYPVLLLSLHPHNHYTILCGATRRGAWIACSLGAKVSFLSWSTLKEQVIGMVAVRPTQHVALGAKGNFQGKVFAGKPTKTLMALTMATTWSASLSIGKGRALFARKMWDI